MSFDYSVITRGRKRSVKALRSAAKKVLGQIPNGALCADECDEEEEGEDLELTVKLERGGGTVVLRRLKRGYELSVDSMMDGNRDHFEEVGEFADALAAELGKIVEDEDLIDKMREETDEDDAKGEFGSMVVMSLEDRAGEALESAQLDIEHFATLLAPGGMLVGESCWAPPMAKEPHRFNVPGAAAVVALVHDKAGKPYRRHRWHLDGYGRICGIEVRDI